MNASDEHARIDAEIDRVEKSSDPFAAAVRATRMPMLITDPNKPDNPVVFANEAFIRLTGYSRAEIIGHNCRFLQGPRPTRPTSPGCGTPSAAARRSRWRSSTTARTAPSSGTGC